MRLLYFVRAEFSCPIHIPKKTFKKTELYKHAPNMWIMTWYDDEIGAEDES